jgi:hypothetical protein
MSFRLEGLKVKRRRSSEGDDRLTYEEEQEMLWKFYQYIHHNIHQKIYQKIHKEKANENNRRWRKKNPEKIAEIHSHRRSLGFNPWNRPFFGSEAHHLNKDGDVIYIPKELHKSIKHSLKTGLNIDKINELAIEYLYETWKKA